ncbi:RNA polymerase sigma-70 factor [Reichenbachiella sp.]|uniref:RNA polymerase sigma-70 factor n=1 Tax=Reichenbachiella sp. TaxID=2184521 RepID=UPI003298D7DA
MSSELERIIKQIALKSDTRAFRQLFDLYNDRLLKIAQYYVKREVLAEEIVADVFVNVWKNRQKLIDVDKLDYYLFTLVKRRSIDYIRKAQKEFTIPMNAVHEETIKTDLHPESEMLYQEFEAVVNMSISLMPPKTQLIYKMVKEDGLKYKHVAEILDITDKTVEYHIGQALKNIRQHIYKYQSSDNRSDFLHKLASLGAILICSSDSMVSLTIYLS